MLLIQKSPRLPTDAAVAVWLHRTTRFSCANARKMQWRRTAGERRIAGESHVASTVQDEVDDRDEREHILPLLDEAITHLGERDRSGVILAFFQQRTFREIGATLGTSEDAARKRVSRAVERMREYFLSRGVATLSAAPIVATFAHESSLVAPASLVSATTKLTAVTHLAALAFPSAQIAQKVMHAMLMWKVKLATAACAAIVAASAVTAAAVHQLSMPSAAPSVVASSAVVALAPVSFEAKASDETTVQFLGIAKWGAPADEWFALDGSKIDDPRGPFARNRSLQAFDGTTHQVMLHIAGKHLDGGYNARIPGCENRTWDLTPDDDTAFVLIPFAAPKDRTTVDIELDLADGDWQLIGTGKNEPGHGLGDFETDFGSIALTHVIDNPARGGCMVYVAHTITGPQFEIFAVDQSGGEHRCVNLSSSILGNGKFYTNCFEFNLPADAVASVNVKVRPFNKRVTAKNVSLDPSKPTKPTIDVSEIKPEATKQGK
jgi:RNA polymerase sigma factor (sigma-70 family)